MQLRPFGKTGLNVTPIGLGLAALGRPGYINLGHSEDLQADYDRTRMQARTSEMLDLAYEVGIRYFDTARSYGRAEAFMAHWLEENEAKSQDLAIGSKWGYTYTADWKVEAEKHEVKEHTLPVLNRQWGESQELLGANLDIYHIHSATLDSGVLDNKAVLDRLYEIKQAGTIVGLSLSGAGQGDTLWKALEVQRGGEQLFGSVQATWNLLEPAAGEALKAAHEAGWGVIIKEALANGRLTPRNNAPDFAATRQVLTQHTEALDMPIDALAIAHVLAQPWVDVVLSGAATAEHLRSNLKALTQELPEDIVSELAALRESSDQYWQTRKQLAWN